MKADIYDKLLNELCTTETKLGFTDDKIWGIPIWRLVHVRYRNYFISVLGGIPAMSNHSQFNFSKLFISAWKSFITLFSILLQRKEFSNIFFGFPRLEKIDEKYIDKFIDPIILQSKIGDDYIYLERGRSGEHKSPRYINENILWTEFIDFFSYLLSILLLPIWWMCNIKKYHSILQKIDNVVRLCFKQKLHFINLTTRSYIKIAILSFLFRYLKAKRLFMPVALIHSPYLFACKKAKVKIYEIQHGITVNNTTTYSGEYNPQWYPDCFLAFGKNSTADYLFGVPKNKVLNIGFAFNSLLTHTNSQIYHNTFLFLSDPEITDVMVYTLIELAKKYPQYSFHFRPHPQEKLNKHQISLIEATSNTILVDCSENSTLACLRYEGVIAENTSVLYEAISVGVKAARLQYNGLTTIHYPNEPEGLFYYMKNPESFKFFAEEFVLNNIDKEIYYSTFDANLFNSLL